MGPDVLTVPTRSMSTLMTIKSASSVDRRPTAAVVQTAQQVNIATDMVATSVPGVGHHQQEVVARTVRIAHTRNKID